MKIERVARTLLGAAALCGLLMNAGCNAGLSSNNSGGSSGGSSGGTPIANVKAPGDWGMSLLAGGTVGVGMVPAKFTFDATAPPNCLSDYVAFNTSLAGGASLAQATQTGSFNVTPTVPPGTTVTVGNPTLGTSIVLTADAINNAGFFFQTSAVGTTQATNLANAIARNGGTVGATATTFGGTATVLVTATLAGSGGNSITLATTINNTQFSWSSGTLAGGLGTASIVAFNQLYASQGGSLPVGLCGSNGPSVNWTYYTGNGTAVTSVVLSEDGTKVAFVENVGGTATLRILKWKAGEGVSVGFPVAPTTTLTAGQNWTTNCPAANSCMSSIGFSGGAADTKSAPFYLYRGIDVLYVGDDNGRVHKFTGVFSGTPAEVTTAPWPITVNAGAILTGPIYESGSGNIFVGDNTGRLSFIREAGSTAGTCTPQPCLDTNNIHIGGAGGSIDDAPVVDGSTGLVIATNSTDGTNFGTILQAKMDLTSPVSFKIGGSGVGGNGSPIYSGAFDNTYFSTPASGHMYICGKAAPNRDRPAVFQLAFNASGVLTGIGPLPLGDTTTFVTASGEACSPVTEFFNTTTGKDWIFFSIGNLAIAASPIPLGACQTNNAGCVMSVDVTGGPAWPPAVVNNAAPVPGNNAGSTSGFVVDNQADTTLSPQASSFYFTLGGNSTGAGPGVPSCNTTAGVGCAVKLTQSGLN